jgi:hypothetical protein
MISRRRLSCNSTTMQKANTNPHKEEHENYENAHKMEHNSSFVGTTNPTSVIHILINIIFLSQLNMTTQNRSSNSVPYSGKGHLSFQ